MNSILNEDKTKITQDETKIKKESSTHLNDDLHSEDSDEDEDFIHGYNDGLNAFKHQQHQIINISKCTFNITNLNINK